MSYIEFNWILEFRSSVEINLKRGIDCYNCAKDCFAHVSTETDKHELVLKRISNAQNEIGVFYMNQMASGIVQTEGI